MASRSTLLSCSTQASACRRAALYPQTELLLQVARLHLDRRRPSPTACDARRCGVQHDRPPYSCWRENAKARVEAWEEVAEEKASTMSATLPGGALARARHGQLRRCGRSTGRACRARRADNRTRARSPHQRAGVSDKPIISSKPSTGGFAMPAQQARARLLPHGGVRLAVDQHAVRAAAFRSSRTFSISSKGVALPVPVTGLRRFAGRIHSARSGESSNEAQPGPASLSDRRSTVQRCRVPTPGPQVDAASAARAAEAPRLFRLIEGAREDRRRGRCRC